jgi:hypothetical protein
VQRALFARADETPISGLPEIGTQNERKSGKPDLRGPNARLAKRIIERASRGFWVQALARKNALVRDTISVTQAYVSPYNALALSRSTLAFWCRSG